MELDTLRQHLVDLLQGGDAQWHICNLSVSTASAQYECHFSGLQTKSTLSATNTMEPGLSGPITLMTLLPTIQQSLSMQTLRPEEVMKFDTHHITSLRMRETMAGEQTKTQELLAILETRSWTKAERARAREQISLYYERKLASLQTALFEAIALDSPKRLSSFEIDEYIHRYHKQSQELYVYINYRSSSNEALPMWLRAIDEDERGISVWWPATKLPQQEQQKD